MVGRRKNNPLGLEPRVYPKHGAFYYVHRNGRWEKLGTDIEKANERARVHNDSRGLYGTMVYWLDMFIVDCEEREKNRDLSKRTLEDYRRDIEPLKIYFEAPMLPTDIEPNHVQTYLKIGAKNKRPVRANRERACLSACMSWLIRSKKVEGLIVNPCMRASGIKRNRERKRERYVTHEEYREVFAVAPPQVQSMMELTYRTLQRPESDILDWTLSNITTKDGKRILRVAQGKTNGKVVDINISEDLDKLLRKLVGDIPRIGTPLICCSRGKHKGKRYTYDGISSMLKRSIAKANQLRKKNDVPETIPSFGFRDLKGKGATDMWLSGIPIEEIQLLCGHEDKATTEAYIKQRWRETATPNLVIMTV
ncbi:MAG: tyrosine-type recombinase/integrase [Gallionella sp.]|nr:tyrosine-type recombinase/integrase [Gallionella sp.]